MRKPKEGLHEAPNEAFNGRNQAGVFLKASLLIIGILVVLGFFFTERNTRTRLIKGYNAEHSPEGSAIHIEGNRYGMFYVLKIADEFAKAIVEADGGSITADSEEGHGTVMKIRYRMEA